MIDLTKGLPNAILSADGEPILLNTDYRNWIRFYADLENDIKEVDISYLFQNKAPVIDDFIYTQLLQFLYNPSVTPISKDKSNVKTLDYILDGEYIYSALYQTYGIDIIDMDMHWHKFLALCNNITGENTLWGYAKQMRAYKKPSKSDTYEKQCEQSKKAWTFPHVETEQEKEARRIQNEKFDKYFAGTEYKGGD